MSGEAGGVLVGGLLLLTAAPFIIGGAAVAGTVYGAYKISETIGKEVAEQQRRKRIQINNCSEDLAGLYDKMKKSLERQEELDKAYYQGIAKDLKFAADNLKILSEKKTDVSMWEQELRSTKEKISAVMGSEKVKELERIHVETRNEIREYIKEIEKTRSDMNNLIDWNTKTVESKAKQKVIANELLRDANASVKLLESLLKSSSDEMFRQKVEVMVKQCQSAESSFENAMYDIAVVGAQNVISKSAILVLEHMQEEIHTDELKIELKAKITGLAEEMKSRRYLKFENKFEPECEGEIEEDLNDFSQGQYEVMQKKLQDMLDNIDELAIDRIALMEANNEFENVIKSNAEIIVNTSQNAMISYYEKLNVMQKVTDFMDEQNYVVEWNSLVDDDATQKMAISFENKISNNKITITLDQDVNAKEMGNMMMEVLHFYDKDNEVTENEKKMFYSNLTNALNDEGIGGTIGCTGAVNEASPRIEFKDEEKVSEMKGKKLIEIS